MKRKKFRWRAPDGRQGRWLNTLEGALKSAATAKTRRPGSGIRISFCVESALSLWPRMVAEGWIIETCRKTK